MKYCYADFAPSFFFFASLLHMMLTFVSYMDIIQLPFLVLFPLLPPLPLKEGPHFILVAVLYARVYDV